MSFFSAIGDILGVAAAPFTGGASLAIPALSAGADIVGGLLQNNSAASQARAQEVYQTNMSDTSYQRAVADMKAAGLNPMLAYQNGGASTPSGAMAPVQNVLHGAGSSALDAATSMQNLENMKSTNLLTKAQASKALADARLSTVQASSASAALPAAQNKAAVENTWFGKGAAYWDRFMSSVNQLPILHWFSK